MFDAPSSSLKQKKICQDGTESHRLERKTDLLSFSPTEMKHTSSPAEEMLEPPSIDNYDNKDAGDYDDTMVNQRIRINQLAQKSDALPEHSR